MAGGRAAGGTMRVIGDLPTLPIFFKLKGRVAVLAGGSRPAVWKAELLAAAGAEVRVFDASPSDEMRELAETLHGVARIEERAWTVPDLEGAALAIGALEGDNAEEFRQAAVAAGVPVNIIDVPRLCDFQFGTIVERGPLVIAISTDGAAPVFGQALRTRIEALLTPEIEAWARAAKDWRPSVQGLALGFPARRRFWEEFADRALSGAGRPPNEADRQACVDAALDEGARLRGAVDLVGLGPGQRDRLTLEAVRILQAADVIVHDPAIGPDLLGLARREARRVPEFLADAETDSLIATLIAGGERVAWVALGDPACCERWHDRRASLTTPPRSIVAGLRCDICLQPTSRLADQ